MNTGQTLTVSYYQLKENKFFNDGSVINSDARLRKIPPEEKKRFTVETFEDEREKKIFWVKTDEVSLIENKTEIWTLQMLAQQESRVECINPRFIADKEIVEKFRKQINSVENKCEKIMSTIPRLYERRLLTERYVN